MHTDKDGKLDSDGVVELAPRGASDRCAAQTSIASNQSF